jgi:hypothetical protein
MAHPPEPPEHGTEHVHDDHGHGNDHGHGHGHGAPLAFPIIPENSGADKLLICLAFFALAGWLTFAAIMLTAKPHHGEDASPSHTEAPAGSHGEVEKSGASPDHAGSSTDHGNQAPEEHH